MGTTSDKLTYLNTTKGKIKDVINMTGANITSDTTFRNYATKLYDGYISVLKDKNTLLDNMPKGTSTGTINDAADLPLYEDKMSKESSQDGTPTPENPIEVKTVKGYRNLFDKTLTGTIVSNRLKTKILPTGIKVICNIRETSSQANNAVRYVTIDITNYIGKKISLFCHAKSSSTNKGFFYIRLCKQNGDTSNDYSTQISSETLDGDLSVTYEIPSGIGEYHYLMIAIYGNRNSPCEINDYVDYTNLMLVEGENKYPYVPYGTNYVYTAISNGTDTNYYTIPLNGNEIAGIGDYKDELIVDKNGYCWLNKKTGKVVLDGSENWQSTGSAYAEGIRFHQFAISVNDKKNGYFDLLCNRFANVSPAKPNKIVGSNDNKRMLINIADSYLNDDLTVSGFKVWLSTHNTEVYYVLATPEPIDLNYTVDLTLFEGVNNISNSDDMDMEIKYIKDTYE